MSDGEKLYEMYMNAQNVRGVGIDTWDELPGVEQECWDSLGQDLRDDGWRPA